MYLDSSYTAPSGCSSAARLPHFGRPALHIRRTASETANGFRSCGPLQTPSVPVLPVQLLTGSSFQDRARPNTAQELNFRVLSRNTVSVPQRKSHRPLAWPESQSTSLCISEGLRGPTIAILEQEHQGLSNVTYAVGMDHTTQLHVPHPSKTLVTLACGGKRTQAATQIEEKGNSTPKGN